MIRPSAAVAVLCAAALAGPSPAAHADDGTVKVFILSGQSNMVGWAHVRTLPHLGEDPAHADLYRKIARKNGAWIERDDVFVDACVDDKSRIGNLTVGYGGGREEGEWIGPELAFGIEMGEHFEEPVLLVKAAWGGKDLYCDFRPPSAGAPAYDIPPRGDQPREPGAYYERLVGEVTRALTEMKRNFPKLRKREPELCGFVWFQGWNEMFADASIQDEVFEEYPSNFAHLVGDLRAALRAPDLPVVVGEMGVNGADANEKTMKLRAAQAAIPAQRALRGTCRFVETASSWDAAVDDAFRHKEQVNRDLLRELRPKVERKMKRKLRGKEKKEADKLVRRESEKLVREKKEWQRAQAEFERIGSHWLCHYHGSAKTYSVMGRAFGLGMLELVEDR